jgi:putative lipoprotein
MRSIKGQIIVPPNAPRRKAHTITIEVHDISVADAPSKMLSQSRLANAQVKPNDRLAFQIDAPELTGRMLAFRVHVDWDGDGAISSGDLLTTQIVPVPSAGETKQVQVPVTLI